MAAASARCATGKQMDKPYDADLRDAIMGFGGLLQCLQRRAQLLRHVERHAHERGKRLSALQAAPHRQCRQLLALRDVQGCCSVSSLSSTVTASDSNAGY